MATPRLCSPSTSSPSPACPQARVCGVATRAPGDGQPGLTRVGRDDDQQGHGQHPVDGKTVPAAEEGQVEEEGTGALHQRAWGPPQCTSMRVCRTRMSLSSQAQ